MYIASKNSKQKIIHKSSCRYAKQIKKENRIYFHTVQEGEENGYTLCKDCCDISRYYKAEYTEILQFSLDNGLSVRFNREDGSLDILTPYSQWKIVVRGQKHYIFLYHKNDFYIVGENSSVPGYHSQKVRRNTIIGYLEYIVEHDAYRKKNPLSKHTPQKNWRDKHYRKGSKKYKKQQKRIKRVERAKAISRVEELLKMIEA